jgi:hypothetical protein
MLGSMLETPRTPLLDTETEHSANKTGSRPIMVHRIKQALVTSRVTLGAQGTGLDPYDSRHASSPGSIWSDRTR